MAAARSPNDGARCATFMTWAIGCSLVATDRISAFDWVLPNGIPDKGRVLTGLSASTGSTISKVPNHLISTDVDDAGLDLTPDERERSRGRSMLVRKARVVPFECVVRGYLSGSGWKEYRARARSAASAAGRAGRKPARSTPIFTPATKAETGHDENVSFEFMAECGRQGSRRVRYNR